MASHTRNSAGRAPRVIGGRWEIVNLIAQGGMGAIYEAKHRQTGRTAAVKVIEGDQPEALARFKLEASVAAQLGHPGVVEVFDADFDPETSTCFIAMELLRGRTLRQVMDDPKAMPLTVVELLSLALEPLAAAHAKGYVHRDLKPENIFVLEEHGRTSRVKLLDFGIAAQEGVNRLTRTGTAMGTPHYMSPEQATNARTAGPASDVWSMGVMLYEAIRGDLPFRGETAHAIIVQACTCDHEPLDRVVPGCDSELSALIDRCLSKEPQARPLDAGVLLCELRMFAKPNSLPAARPHRRSLGAISEASGMRSRTLEPEPFAIELANSGARRLMFAGVALLSLAAMLCLFFGLPPEAGLVVAAIGGAISISAASRIRDARTKKQRSLSLTNNQATVVKRPREPMPSEMAHPTRGPENAPVTLELYADLSSALTRRLSQRVMSLRSEHAENVRVIWKPMPDPTRDLSWTVAETLRDVFERCGNDLFWNVHDRLLVITEKISHDLVMELAKDAGVELHELNRALRARVRRRSVAYCREQAIERGALQSPALFLNGQLLTEDLTDDRLRWALYDAINERRQKDIGGMRTEFSDTTAQPKRVRGTLIRYRGARNATPLVRRSRDEARERANKLLARAKMPGENFADLALRFGDSALDLDALDLAALDEATLRAVRGMVVGQVSEPLECDEGFRVLQRAE